MNLRPILFASVLTGCSPEIKAMPDSGLADAPSASDARSDTRAACDALALPTISVAKADPNGYPPYAIDGCQLAYVSSNGNLILRELGSGAEEVIASAIEQPRRPCLKDGVIAWEGTNTEGKSQVHVRDASRLILRVSGAFDHAGEPRLSAGALVFTAWKGDGDLSDSSINVFDLATETLLELDANGQQRFADVSATHVLYTDFGEDPDGTFNNNETDVADIAIYDRVARTTTTRKLTGKQAFARVADTSAMIYLSWKLIHPEPKLAAYELMTGPISANVTADREVALVTQNAASGYILPSAQNGLVEWVGGDGLADSATRLWRTRLDVIAPVSVDGLDALSLGAPAAHPQFTLLSVRPNGALSPELRLLTK